MKRLLLPFVFALSLWGADAASDARLSDQIKLRLAGDRDVKVGAAIDVDVKDGVATLRGKVETQSQKARAEKVAHKTRGVKEVKNELVITPL